jgi:hypothetical protein
LTDISKTKEKSGEDLLADLANLLAERERSFESQQDAAAFVQNVANAWAGLP